MQSCLKLCLSANPEFSNLCSNKVNERKSSSILLSAPLSIYFICFLWYVIISETQKTQKILMSEAVMFWTSCSLACMLIWKLAILQLWRLLLLFCLGFFNDLQKLWNFDLSGIIMKFLYSSFFSLACLSLEMHFHSGYYYSKCGWKQTIHKFLLWTLWGEGYLGFWHVTSVRFCSKPVLIFCTAQIRTDSLWTAWL